jgi:hypothetical protein
MTMKLPETSSTNAGIIVPGDQTIPNGDKTFSDRVIIAANPGDQAALVQITNPNAAGRGLSITLSGHSSVNREILQCINSGGMVFEVDGNGAINNSTTTLHTGSDLRLKENIEPVTGVLNAIKQLNVVSFNYKRNPGEKQVGLIAQEVEQILPQVVRAPLPDKTEVDNYDAYSYYNIKYNDVFMIAIRAIQEQQVIIEDLKKQVEELKTRGGANI